jgi:hypothetical protein
VRDWQLARAALAEAHDRSLPRFPRHNANMLSTWQAPKRGWARPPCFEACCWVDQCGKTQCHAPLPRSRGCLGWRLFEPFSEKYHCMEALREEALSDEGCRAPWCGPCWRDVASTALLHPHRRFLRVGADGSHTVVERAEPPDCVVSSWGETDVPVLSNDMAADVASGLNAADDCFCGASFAGPDAVARGGVPFCPRAHRLHRSLRYPLCREGHNGGEFAGTCCLKPKALCTGCVASMYTVLGANATFTTPDGRTTALCETCDLEDALSALDGEYRSGFAAAAEAWASTESKPRGAYSSVGEGAGAIDGVGGTAASVTAGELFAWAAASDAAFAVLHTRPAAPVAAEAANPEVVAAPAAHDANWPAFVRALEAALCVLHPQPLQRLCTRLAAERAAGKLPAATAREAGPGSAEAAAAEQV